MNTAYSQISAYTGQQKEGASQRAIEAQALLSCAAKLHQAQEPETSYELYAEIIRHNQRLWTIFQVSICEADNPLPRDLKITLLNLSRFVDKVSLRALAEQNPALLTSLIDINRNIASGLNMNPENANPVVNPEPIANSFSASI